MTLLDKLMCYFNQYERTFGGKAELCIVSLANYNKLCADLKGRLKWPDHAEEPSIRLFGCLEVQHRPNMSNRAFFRTNLPGLRSLWRIPRQMWGCLDKEEFICLGYLSSTSFYGDDVNYRVRATNIQSVANGSKDPFPIITDEDIEKLFSGWEDTVRMPLDPFKPEKPKTDREIWWKDRGLCPICKDHSIPKPVSQPGGFFICPRCQWSNLK